MLKLNPRNQEIENMIRKDRLRSKKVQTLIGSLTSFILFKKTDWLLYEAYCKVLCEKTGVNYRVDYFNNTGNYAHRANYGKEA